MQRYLKVWWLLTMFSFQTAFITRGGAVIFLLGKLVRFVFFFYLLVIVVGKTELVYGYNLDQIIFFFLTFNLVDITAQVFFREVYRFRPLIISGDFDLVLVKPINPLLRVLLGGADPLDTLTLIPLFGLIFVFATRLSPGTFDILLYIFLVLNAVIIATAFHIAVLAFGVLTTAVDHTIMIYRDFTTMGRIPIDFYNEFLRAIITFVLPVGIMMTIPAKALMGILSFPLALYSFVFGVTFLWAALRFWNSSLKNYSSASS